MAGCAPPELQHAVIIDRVARDLRLGNAKVLAAEGERVDIEKLPPHQRKVTEAAPPESASAAHSQRMLESGFVDSLGNRMKTARGKAGFSQAELGSRIGVSSGAVGQWETGRTDPSNGHLLKAAEVLSVDSTWLSSGRGEMTQAPRAKPPGAEGELLDIAQLPPHQRKVIEAALPNRRAEVWLLTSDAIAGAGYHPSDFLIVDIAATPRARDFVLAESFGLPDFRIFFPPYLFCLSLTGSPHPIIADKDKTVIRGVISSRLSF